VGQRRNCWGWEVEIVLEHPWSGLRGVRVPGRGRSELGRDPTQRFFFMSSPSGEEPSPGFPLGVGSPGVLEAVKERSLDLHDPHIMLETLGSLAKLHRGLCTHSLSKQRSFRGEIQCPSVLLTKTTQTRSCAKETRNLAMLRSTAVCKHYV